jgi:hypothetical protein
MNFIWVIVLSFPAYYTNSFLAEHMELQFNISPFPQYPRDVCVNASHITPQSLDIVSHARRFGSWFYVHIQVIVFILVDISYNGFVLSLAATVLVKY